MTLILLFLITFSLLPGVLMVCWCRYPEEVRAAVLGAGMGFIAMTAGQATVLLFLLLLKTIEDM